MVAWGKPLRQILAEFSCAELAELELYRSIEPWGWRIENRRFGTIAHLLAPKAADELASVENWFTDELPEVSLDDGDEES